MAKCEHCGQDEEANRALMNRLRYRTAFAVRAGLHPALKDEEIERHEKGLRLKAAGVKGDVEQHIEHHKLKGDELERARSLDKFSGFSGKHLDGVSWFDVFCAELMVGIQPAECDYYESQDRTWFNDPSTALEAARIGFMNFRVETGARP